jgi:hypothetical protein
MTNPYVPDAEDVQGVEDETDYKHPPVCVVVDGPVRTQQLPFRGGMSVTVHIQPATSVAASTGGNQTKRFNADPRRGMLTLLATDQPFYYGFDQTAVENGLAATWPINVPLYVRHSDQFWVASANVAGSSLSVIREDWSL